MVYNATRVDIVKKEGKTSTVRTARKMYTSYPNVTSRNNSRTVTGSVTKKKSSGRNKNMTNKRKIKG